MTIRMAGAILPLGALVLSLIAVPATATAAASGGTIGVFDRIPQFGIYTSGDPANYTPPAGVLMWNRGTEFARKLTDAEKALIGDDLRLRSAITPSATTTTGSARCSTSPCRRAPRRPRPRRG